VKSAIVAELDLNRVVPRWNALTLLRWVSVSVYVVLGVVLLLVGRTTSGLVVTGLVALMVLVDLVRRGLSRMQ
jgi:hypothetical protein